MGKIIIVLLLGISLIIGGHVVSEDVGSEQGRLDAERDVNSGIFKIYAIGRPTPYRKYYDEIMLNDHGVEMVRKDRVDSREEKAYINGYNNVSVKAVIDKHGGDIFAKASGEALKRYREEAKR